jgi:hypothetical protein
MLATTTFTERMQLTVSGETFLANMDVAARIDLSALPISAAAAKLFSI